MRLSDFAIQPTKDKIESLACIAIARRFSAESEDITPPGLVECLSDLLKETSPATRPLLQATIQSIQDNVSIIETCPTDLALSLADFAEKYHLPGRTWDRIMEDAAQALKELRLARAITDQDLSRITEAWAVLNNPSLVKAGFQLVPVSELTLQPPDYLVEQLLERDCIADVFGDPETCKSLLMAVDLAACVATRKEFHGHKVHQGKVIVVAGEGHNGLARRFAAWEIRHGISLDNSNLHISKGPAQFCDVSSTAQVIASIDQIVKNEPPVLVIVDTLNRNFGPGDENSTQDMTRFVHAMDQIRTKYGCTVLIIHHTGHGDKTRGRGAMALKGALDAEYRMDKDDSGIVRFWPVKMKDAEKPDPMAFNIRTVQLGIEDDQGRPVTSAIMDRIEWSDPDSAQKGKGKWQRLAQDVLDRLNEEYRQNLEKRGYNPDQVRVSADAWRQSCLEAGIPKNRFYELKKHFKIEHGYVS